MDEKELQTALAKAIRGIIYDQTNHDVSVGTLEEEVKIIILPLLAQPTAQTPASALQEALVLFDELNTRTRLHHDPCRCPEAWPSKGGHYHPGCPKCRICKLESVLRLAATPQATPQGIPYDILEHDYRLKHGLPIESIAPQASPEPRAALNFLDNTLFEPYHKQVNEAVMKLSAAMGNPAMLFDVNRPMELTVIEFAAKRMVAAAEPDKEAER